MDILKEGEIKTYVAPIVSEQCINCDAIVKVSWDEVIKEKHYHHRELRITNLVMCPTENCGRSIIFHGSSYESHWRYQRKRRDAREKANQWPSIYNMNMRYCNDPNTYGADDPNGVGPNGWGCHLFYGAIVVITILFAAFCYIRLYMRLS